MNIRAYFPLNRRICPGDTGALIVTIVLYLVICGVAGVLRWVVGWLPEMCIRDRGKRQADLPQQGVGQSAVIPDTQAEPAVEHKSARQLQRDDDAGAAEHLQQDRPPGVPGVQLADEPEAAATQQKHAAVAPAPPGQLQCHIEHPAQIEDYQLSPKLQNATSSGKL